MATASTLGVPKQGSPKVLVLGKTVHSLFPTHADETIEELFKALHVPILKSAHEPEGLP